MSIELAWPEIATLRHVDNMRLDKLRGTAARGRKVEAVGERESPLQTDIRDGPCLQSAGLEISSHCRYGTDRLSHAREHKLPNPLHRVDLESYLNTRVVAAELLIDGRAKRSRHDKPALRKSADRVRLLWSIARWTAHHNERFGSECGQMYGFRDGWIRNHGQIQRAVHDLPARSGTEAFVHGQPDAREGLTHPADDFYCQQRHERRRYAERYTLGGSRLLGGNFLLRKLQLSEHATTSFEIQLPSTSQSDTARHSDEQLRVQLVLETVDVPRQRRLNEPEFMRGEGDAAQFRNAHEISQAAEVQDAPGVSVRHAMLI